jgi:uncharacterized protein involved in outer membrane biogenesis
VKKILFGVAGLFILLAAVALVVPGYIDWNDYKGVITAQAKAATGRDLVIGGDIRITVLPAPALVAKDVQLANLEGAQAPHMVRMKSLEISIAPGPLLIGRLQVEMVKMVNPVIELEILADGRNNLRFTPAEKDSGPVSAAAPPASATPTGKTDAGPPASALEKSLPAVQLNNFQIENGSLVFRDSRDGSTKSIDGINAKIDAATLIGPFESSGRLVARSIPFSYDVSIGQIIHGRTVPFNLSLGVVDSDALARVSGTLVGLADEPKFKGKVEGNGKRLASLIETVAGTGTLPVFLSQDFEFSGSVVASAGGAEVKELGLRLGDASASGGLKVELGKVPVVAARVNVSSINLDNWLSLPAAARKPSAKRTKPAAAIKKESGSLSPKASTAMPRPKKIDKPLKPAPGFEIPANINGSLNVTVDSITARGRLIRRVLANAELVRGEITLSQLSAQLPGGSNIALFGFVTAADGQPRFEGEMEATVNDPRRILEWIGTAMPLVPADRLRKLTVASRFTATPKRVEATALDIQFDSSRLTGGVTLALRTPFAFGADLTLDRLNLDAYLAALGKAPAGAAKEAAADGGQTKDKGAAEPKAESTPRNEPKTTKPFPALGLLTAFDANLKARVKTLVYRGMSLKDIRFHTILFDNAFTLRQASIAKLAGASAKFSGALQGLSGAPKIKGLRFELKAKESSRLFRLAGVKPPLDAKKLGAVAVKGRIEGPLLKPELALELAAGGGTAKLAGAVSLLGGLSNLDLKAKLKHKDLARLIRVFGLDYQPAGRLGGLGMAARVKGDGEKMIFENIAGTVGPVAVEGRAEVDLAPSRPKISADLRTGKIAIDLFLPAKRKASLPTDWRRQGEIIGDRPGGIIPAAWIAPPLAGNGSLLRQAATKRKDAAGGGRWSREPIDLTALNAFDGAANIKSEAVSFDKYVLENADMGVNLNAGLLKVHRLKGTLFGGAISGNAAVRAAPGNGMEAALSLHKMNLGPVIGAATGKSMVTGKMALDMDLASTGGSVAEMISRLSGNGAFALRRLNAGANGKGSALAGALDLVAGLNRLGGTLGGKKTVSGLADITGSFRIDRGVAKSENLRLVSGIGEGGAKGSVDLPRWLIDIDGEVRLSQNILTRLLAKKTKAATVLPIRIKGRLDAPNVKLDTSKMPGGGLILPGGIEKKLKKKLQKKLEKKGLGGLLRGLIGDKPAATDKQQQPLPPADASPPPPPQEPRKIKPKDLIKGLLKGLSG